jgi:AraC-like DNA-binding protein
MQLTFLNFLLLMAAAQGLLLAALIFHKYRRLFANRMLGLMMIGYSIAIVHNVAVECGYYDRIPILMLIVLGIIFGIIPLQYLYARYLSHPSKKLDKRDWLHFLPMIIYEILIILFFLVDKNQITSNLDNNASTMPIQFVIFNWALALQGFIYMALILRIINKFNNQIKDVFSSIEKIKLGWLQTITYLALLVWAIFVLENALLLFGINLSNFDLSSLLLAVVVYATGYLGLVKSEIYSEPAVIKSIEQLPDLNIQYYPDSDLNSAKAGKYEKSGLDARTAEDYSGRLLRLMQEKKPYTANELTLGQLAEMIGITPHNLSEIINTQLGQNFYDFINRYRLQQVQKDLVDPAKSHLKILSIAFDAGFNSKASFNTLFKKSTNLTPSEYRAKMLKQKSAA